MGRSPSCVENGVKKGPWTPEEDQKLVQYIQKHGHGSWRALPKLAGLNRCGKSCRLRWTNYLRPDIKRGKFSAEEEQTILNLHRALGNKWSTIATYLDGRTDNEIKNFWNTHLKKKLIQQGFDPMTHRPRTDLCVYSLLEQQLRHQSWFEPRAVMLIDYLLANGIPLQIFPSPGGMVLASAAAVNSGGMSSGLPDMEAGSVVNPVVPSSNEAMFINSCRIDDASHLGGLPASQPAASEPVPFTPFPDLQFSGSSGSYELPFSGEIDQESPDFAFVGQEVNSPGSNMFAPSTSPSPLDTESSGVSGGNPVDACSTSSIGDCGGAPTTFWSELFIEDPFAFHDIL